MFRCFKDLLNACLDSLHTRKDLSNQSIKELARPGINEMKNLLIVVI